MTPDYTHGHVTQKGFILYFPGTGQRGFPLLSTALRPSTIGHGTGGSTHSQKPMDEVGC